MTPTRLQFDVYGQKPDAKCLYYGNKDGTLKPRLMLQKNGDAMNSDLMKAIDKMLYCLFYKNFSGNTQSYLIAFLKFNSHRTRYS